MRRWYYTAEGEYLCSHPVGLPPAHWMRPTTKRASYYFDHAGFPGVICDTSEQDGEACTYPPVPGRDFRHNDVVPL